MLELFSKCLKKLLTFGSEIFYKYGGCEGNTKVFVQMMNSEVWKLQIKIKLMWTSFSGPTPTTSRCPWTSWTGCVSWTIPSICVAPGRICTSSRRFAGKSVLLTPTGQSGNCAWSVVLCRTRTQFLTDTSVVLAAHMLTALSLRLQVRSHCGNSQHCQQGFPPGGL